MILIWRKSLHLDNSIAIINKMKLVVITLLLSLNLAAQSNNVLNYKKQLLKFVPKNFEILDTIKGNLNNDSFDDYILVLKKKKWRCCFKLWWW